MTRLMFDGITPSAVPGGADIYAGYNDGKWQSLDGLMADHPGKLYVSICVNASGRARCADIEKGDLTPAQAPGWAEDERRAGNPFPVVYMNASTWPTVKAEFAAQKVAPPLYWVAQYVEDPSKPPEIPEGAIAVQFYDYGGYDVSLVADYWPGLDPAPAPPTPPTPPIPMEDDMSAATPDVYDVPVSAAADAEREMWALYPDGFYEHIPDPESYAGILNLGAKVAVVTYAWHEALLARYASSPTAA